MERLLRILHTNDFHNKLTPEQASTLRRLKDESGPATLLLDAGDAVSAGNVGVRLGGEPVLGLMNDAGYDAMTAGNREFHIADGIFRYKIERASFPVLCANIRRKSADACVLPVRPSISVTLEGFQVAVFGLTVPMVTERMAARLVSAYLFCDPIEEARRQVALLRDRCDVLVALTHIGVREDERLAAELPQIDLIIGGHSHVVLDEPSKRAGVPVVSAGWFAHFYGRVEVCLSDGKAGIVSSAVLPLGRS